MPRAHARNMRLAVLAAVAVAAGCSSVGRYEENPSHSVDLSGSWILDRSLSEDPKPVIEKLRPKPVQHRWDLAPDENDEEAGPPVGRGQQGGSGNGGRSRRGQSPPVVYRNNIDAYTHSMVIKALGADIARADSLTIQQTPERFSLDYGSAVRTFTPGAVSVVSATWGVADQSAGWKGKTFVIRVRPQSGVASTETYELSDDGKRLTEQLQLGGGDFPSVKLKRVYNRADHPIPRSVPVTD